MKMEAVLRSDVARIVAGNASGQAIQLAAMLVIARVYTPSAYGTFAVLVATAAIVFPWAALKLESALVLAKTEEETADVFSVAALAAVTIAVLSGGAVLVMTTLGWVTRPSGPLGAILVASLTASASLVALHNQLAVRLGRYDIVATRPVVQQFSTGLLQTLGGLIASSWLTLGVGLFLGRSVAILGMLRISKSYYRRVGWPRVRAVFSKYWRFPAVFVPSTIVNAAGQQMPLLLAAVFLSSASLGALSMAWQLSLAPVALISAAVAQVFAGSASKTVREGHPATFRLYLRLSAPMAVLAGCLIAIFMLLGEPALTALLGDSWSQAGEFLWLLAFASGACLLANSVSSVFTVHQSGFASLAINLARVALLGAAGVTAYIVELDENGTVGILYGALGIGYLLSWLAGALVAKRGDRRAA